ncbi:MAG: hypothetical protein JWP66_1235 [Naasia sp.]|nr:hypothetical protein [Naasia sp.]
MSVPPSPRADRNGFALASLVLSLVGIVVGIIPLFIGLFLSIVPTTLGLVFGIVGLVRARRLPGNTGFGMALGGLLVAVATYFLYSTGYGIIW